VDGYDGDAGMLVLNWLGARCGPPLLEFRRNGNQLVLAWSTNAASYALKARPSRWGRRLSAGLPHRLLSRKNTVTDTMSGRTNSIG
jgi:hypothetical protein